ncbi:MAG TPA: S8 family serine peptidase, partial [Opitutaceae bacterium]|nr:S8 family serine peptidase [Opitutaceae bacterium]
AGNDQAAQLAWPAADPRVISVGAVDKAEQQVSFSNSGPQLQLSAPGYGVQTAWLDGQRAYVDGTSASAPIVAGAIAAVLSQNPALTPLQAAQLLERTANDAGAPGADPAFGNGILNLGWAMNSGTPGYVDTAVSSHYFDAANNQMQFVVQNRSAQPVSGLTLKITAGNSESARLVPMLAPGETFVVTWPNATALTAAAGGSVRFTTELVNPAGLTDVVPANNRRASVLTAPPTK